MRRIMLLGVAALMAQVCATGPARAQDDEEVQASLADRVKNFVKVRQTAEAAKTLAEEKTGEAKDNRALARKIEAAREKKKALALKQALARRKALARKKAAAGKKTDPAKDKRAVLIKRHRLLLAKQRKTYLAMTTQYKVAVRKKDRRKVAALRKKMLVLRKKMSVTAKQLRVLEGKGGVPASPETDLPALPDDPDDTVGANPTPHP